MALKFVAVVARNDSTGGTLLRKVPTHSRSGDVYLECRTVCYDGEVISILPHAGGSAHAAEASDFAWVRTAMGVEGYMKCAYLRCVVVIGITGCTRCGKGRVSRALSRRLGDTVIVCQDDYWIGAVAVTTPDGNSVTSDEQPECTDHLGFAAAIEDAIKRAAATAGGRDHTVFGVVIAEGFQLLHHERVRDLIGPMPTYLLELSKEECIRRRAQPVHASLKPHPISESHMVAVVWPAYEAYHTQSVAPLFAEGRVVCMPSPETDEDVETIVERICADMGAATSTCTALHISAAERPQIVTAVVARNDSTGGTLLRKVPTHSRSGDVYLECRTVCYDGEVISILPHAGGSAHAAEASDFAWVRTAMGVEGYMKCAYLRCVVVIGITGCTRCGKGRVSRALSRRLGDTVIVCQDDYWIGAVAVTTPDGNSVTSDEQPECTDHLGFAAAIEDAIKRAAATAGGRNHTICGVPREVD